MDDRQHKSNIMYFDYKQNGKVNGLITVHVTKRTESQFEYIFEYEYRNGELICKTKWADKNRFYERSRDYLESRGKQ